MRAIALAVMMTGAGIEAALRGKEIEPSGGAGLIALIFIICLIMRW
jgi:hypothetical protein